MASDTEITMLNEVKPAALRQDAKPTETQRKYLERALQQPGGKLPLFDLFGQKYSDKTIQTCIENGWAEPWFNNPLKPDWLICKITAAGRDIVCN